MDSTIGRHLFQKRNERIDWRKLAAVDVEKIAREVDVNAIQENILNVTYCNVEHELGYHGLDANVIKLFRLAQLTIEYLLHSQEFLQQCLSDKDKKVDSYSEQLNISVSQCGVIKDELSKRNDSYKSLKKELQKAKKIIGDYQLMVRAGAGGLHRCASCTKSFVSEYYLRSHVERRHPEQVKHYEQHLPNVSALHDETLHNELEDIRSRLKATEDELKREHENVYQLSTRETKRNQEFAEILKRNEIWKNEEEEQIKAEMEGYKKLMMKELKETQRENNELKKNLHNLQQSTELWKSSALGSLEDADGVTKVQYEDLGAQVRDLSQEVSELLKENAELKKATENLRSVNGKLTADEEKYEDLNSKVQKIEIHFKKEFERLSNGYQNDLEEAKELCNGCVERVKKSEYLSSLKMMDVVDTKPLKSPRAYDIETDSVTFWVSSNSSITNCFKVSQKAASPKGEWNDIFSLRALLSPGDLFEKPIYVYSSGGSPYWRQYVSLSDQPPSPNYKREMTFYGSATKLVGTLKYHILDTGSSTVIRSMISRKESCEGWKEKGAYFYALKGGVSRNSLNRSGTYNSDVFRSVSDDEVSLSSLTGTDVARDTLAEALKLSRDNLSADVNVLNIEGDKQQNSDNESVTESEKDLLIHESSEVDREEREEDKFIGTSSSSFFGSTLPEKGQFYPFPNNLLAVSRYNHSAKMINAQREEMIKILEDHLIKRGVNLDEKYMTSANFESKLRYHEKEVKLLEKKYPGCIEHRKRLLKSVEEFSAAHTTQKKSKMSDSWKVVDTVVKAAVRFSDDVTPIRKRSPDTHAPPFSSSFQVTSSTPKEQEKSNNVLGAQPNFGGDDFDVSDENTSDWNSDILETKQIRTQKKTLSATESNMSVNDFVSAPGPHDYPVEKETITRLSSDSKDADFSDSSQWDSDEISAKHRRDSPELLLSNTFEEPYNDALYNPKMRPPTGEKVKELTASLEYTLGSRDSSKKKPAGAVDLHHM